MADANHPENEEELLDYEDDNNEEAEDNTAAKGADQSKKAGYVGIHATGFKDFLLKPELGRAIMDCGFEHPSEGEHAARKLGGSGSRWTSRG